MEGLSSAFWCLQLRQWSTTVKVVLHRCGQSRGRVEDRIASKGKKSTVEGQAAVQETLLRAKGRSMGDG
jgi:hypothetical protein